MCKSRHDASEPEISYKDAMALRWNGASIKDINAYTFGEIAEQQLVMSAPPDQQKAIRSNLAGHDWRYPSDRWHGVLTLLEHGIDVYRVFQRYYRQ